MKCRLAESEDKRKTQENDEKNFRSKTRILDGMKSTEIIRVLFEYTRLATFVAIDNDDNIVDIDDDNKN